MSTRTMTLRELFQRMPRDGWYLNAFGCIRRNDCQCPITSVCPKYSDEDQWKRAARRIGLDIHIARCVVFSADGSFSIDDHNLVELRQRLLAHCGLEET